MDQKGQGGEDASSSTSSISLSGYTNAEGKLGSSSNKSYSDFYANTTKQLLTATIVSSASSIVIVCTYTTTNSTACIYTRDDDEDGSCSVDIGIYGTTGTYALMIDNSGCTRYSGVTLSNSGFTYTSIESIESKKTYTLNDYATGGIWYENDDTNDQPAVLVAVYVKN